MKIGSKTIAAGAWLVACLGTLPLYAAEPEGVVAYTLSATLDPVQHTLHGQGTIVWRNTSRIPIETLWMHLYLNAFKNQSSAFLRPPLTGLRGPVAPKTWGSIDVRTLVLRGHGFRQGVDLWRTAERTRPGDPDETDVRIPLPYAVAPQDSLTLDVTWDALLPGLLLRTGYSGAFHFLGQWFPKLARLEPDGVWAHFPFAPLGEFYADYGRFDVTLDLPEAFRIGATGVNVSTRIAQGRRVERYVQDHVHDFAWTAWDRWETMTEPIHGVAVTVLHPPGYTQVAERELETLRFALPDFAYRYGTYPYPTLTVVHPPADASEAGGMEYPTLITTGGSRHTPRGVHTLELVTLHEFAHQYFYGLLGSNEVAWPFLDEGLTSYAEQEALTRWKGAGSLFDLFGLKIGDLTLHSLSNRAAHLEPIAQPSFAFQSAPNYSRLVYGRTSALLETLRRVYGSEPMATALHRYATTQRFRHPVPEDLLQVMRETLGAEAAENLRLGLFERGWVDYAVQAVTSRRTVTPAGLFDPHGVRTPVQERRVPGSFVSTVDLVRRGTLVFPVTIEQVFADGSRTRHRWDGHAATHRITSQGPSPLVGARIDPEAQIVVDETRTNNHATCHARPLRHLARTFERLVYWMQLLLQWIA